MMITTLVMVCDEEDRCGRRCWLGSAPGSLGRPHTWRQKYSLVNKCSLLFADSQTTRVI